MNVQVQLKEYVVISLYFQVKLNIFGGLYILCFAQNIFSQKKDRE